MDWQFVGSPRRVSASDAAFIAALGNHAEALLEVAKWAQIVVDTSGSATLEHKMADRLAMLREKLAALENI